MDQPASKPKKPHVFAVGQINEYGNEIVKVCEKTLEVALAPKNLKGTRLDLIGNLLYTLPDGRWVQRQRKEDLLRVKWRTPRTIQTPAVFRPTTTQYLTFEKVEAAGSEGLSTKDLTANEKRVCRELEKLRYIAPVAGIDARRTVYTVDKSCKPFPK